MILPALAAAAGGLLLSLAFPPARFDLLIWIAFLPLFWALDHAKRPASALYLGILFGLTFSLVDVNWVYHTVTVHGGFGPVGGAALYVSMALTLALFPGVFALVVTYLGRRGWSLGIAAPFVWTAVEYARAVAFTTFPWDLVGYSQVGRLPIVQIADITGVYGISFLVVLVNGTLWEVLRRVTAGKKFPVRLVGVTVLLFLSALAYGAVRLSQYPPPRPRQDDFPVGVLQGDIPQEMKWNPDALEYTFLTYKRLGRAAVKNGAKLLIWPETSVPLVFGPTTKAWKIPGAISRGLGVPMLVGAPSERKADGKSSYFNSAFLVDRSSLRFRYDKIRLVPFGEYMPFSWLLPLGPGMAARQGDYTPGRKMTVMHVEGCPPFSVLICYEAIFPDLAALALKNGARMLVNITNDAWFGESAAPYQHLGMARMRSIEDRVWFLRSANTGVSAAFDRAGRVIQKIPLDMCGQFVVRVPERAQAGSFYSRFGDLFAWVCVLTVMVAFIPRLRPRLFRAGPVAAYSRSGPARTAVRSAGRSEEKGGGT
jgi:apolipoprotein N-acyltransferase